MKIIRDLRILNAIGRRYNLTFDKDYKYITSNTYEIPHEFTYKNTTYTTKYFSGCFNPYVIIKNKE